MILHRIRRAAAVLALVAVLALAAPAHAAGWRDLAAGPAWLEQALEWVARLWVGGEEPTTPKPAIEKCGGGGADPNGACSGAAAPPPQSPTASSAGDDGSDG